VFNRYVFEVQDTKAGLENKALEIMIRDGILKSCKGMSSPRKTGLHESEVKNSGELSQIRSGISF
jgi:hypothetical protein